MGCNLVSNCSVSFGESSPLQALSKNALHNPRILTALLTDFISSLENKIVMKQLLCYILPNDIFTTLNKEKPNEMLGRT